MANAQQARIQRAKLRRAFHSQSSIPREPGRKWKNDAEHPSRHQTRLIYKRVASQQGIVSYVAKGHVPRRVTRAMDRFERSDPVPLPQHTRRLCIHFGKTKQPFPALSRIQRLVAGKQPLLPHTDQQFNLLQSGQRAIH